jgi:hypothetical protein
MAVMAVRNRIQLKRATAAVLTAGLSVFGAPLASAQQATLEGSWTGNGTVTFSTGNVEAAKCKASFRRHSTDKFAMNAVCATPSGRVAQTAELNRLTNSRFSGEFQNLEYGVTGNITITVKGNSLTASLDGGGATASFSLSR